MNILTDEEIFKCLPAEEDSMEFARAIEAAVLSKLADQDVGRANWKPLPEDQNERITFDRALHNIYEGDARLAVAITLRTFANAMSGGTFADTCRVMANEVAKLYTEAQLLAAQQRTAEACAESVRDAARYRYLREWWFCGPEGSIRNALCPDELDAEIDAAIGEEK